MEHLLARAASRRALLKTACVAGSIAVVPGCAQQAAKVATLTMPPPPPVPVHVAPAPVAVAATPAVAPPGIRAALFDRARNALDRHGNAIARRDRIALADFSKSSSSPRLHLINLHDGTVTSLLVAHGSGSDPAHTGWLQRFSNEVNSEASCEGAFLTSDYYVGKHGRSQRLIGLDPTNNNALDRAIVVHGAWYSNEDMLAKHGKLGRSQGCFAVGETTLATVFDLLGEGRMIYAAKV
ncbi:murein L,D-transpeptidase catalytic domain family protein [Sphingomonas floccifaciens]|uniref:Murein L,D-transpeptidase catalytic domain family protein n=1 Tax=Sphingomonas floccifaciens TaxID=1844115 RepID=A0ABW4NEI6_9SPHN